MSALLYATENLAKRQRLAVYFLRVKTDAATITVI